ncbi:GAF domain-containing protein [Nguyenibacter sp. L1]|uniref:GAF domain-containing protein n=1 Tax=Nguyenibacter sp. L1 TaxID=3049350 RepID=UPI002B49EA57|nr:GAF domain-containing protein [Nguyenibacter sp. L1]WRH88815.1 GAF domain-containing protein [Nguyenibacter sp. L1]
MNTLSAARITPDDLLSSIAGVLAGEHDLVANCANVAALIFEALPRVNWAGFYLLRGDELVLGPFQGRVACTRIALGAGVCGTAAARRETVVVPDVHAFPGHIACDAASESEIVIPVLSGDRLIGVLDIDSPVKDRFTPQDRRMLEEAVALLVRALPAPPSAPSSASPSA